MIPGRGQPLYTAMRNRSYRASSNSGSGLVERRSRTRIENHPASEAGPELVAEIGEAPEVGEVAVHFPRAGFRVERA